MPKHLEGKSAVEIVVEMHNRFGIGADSDENDYIMYAQYLEKVLVLAVEHALLNADEVKELITEGQYNAMPRAVAFLNTILSYENKSI